MQFLTSGLDKLVKNLPADELIQTSELAEELNVPLSILKRKGVYPYSWVNSVERFAATELPPVEAFHSDLDDKKCKRDDYKHERCGRRLNVRPSEIITTSMYGLM